MTTIDPLHMSAADIASASEAWRVGGTLMLGSWLAHYKPRFSTREYGQLVELVRAALGDETDYSKED